MKDTLNKCLLGISAPGLGYAISFSNIELWLRLASLTIGILVGLLTLVSLGLTVERKWRERKLKRRLRDEDTD